MELLYYKSDASERPQDSVLLRKVSKVEWDGSEVIRLHTATRVYELAVADQEHGKAWSRLLEMLSQ